MTRYSVAAVIALAAMSATVFAVRATPPVDVRPTPGGAASTDDVAAAVAAGVVAVQAGETTAERDARMAWWRDARFGMFIHWGLYAVPAGEYQGKRGKDIGEWIMSWANIPRADYEKFAAQFNPVKFDAATIVRTA